MLISPPGVVVVAAFSPGFSKRLGSRLGSMTLSPQRKLLLRLAINISIFSSLPPSQDNLPLLIHSSIICTSGCISNNPFSYEAMDGYFFFFFRWLLFKGLLFVSGYFTGGKQRINTWIYFA